MPYDPTFPATDAFLVSAQFRNQFTGLFDLIQSIPVGPPGPQGGVGPQGPAGNGVVGAVIDGVTTLDPGAPATASASFDGSAVHFSFAIPRGVNGADGAQGLQGATGPAFVSFVADPVNTLPAGSSATVDLNFDGSSMHIVFGLPRGADGEVTHAQLDTAIGGTAVNPSAIASLGLTISDPPTQAELQAVSDKVDELLAVLRRI